MMGATLTYKSFAASQPASPLKSFPRQDALDTRGSCFRPGLPEMWQTRLSWPGRALEARYENL